jgi:ribonuclease-3
MIGISLLNAFSQAYVGGLYREQGMDVVRKWLRMLLLLDIKEAYEIIRSEHLLPPL